MCDFEQAYVNKPPTLHNMGLESASAPLSVASRLGIQTAGGGLLWAIGSGLPSPEWPQPAAPHEWGHSAGICIAPTAVNLNRTTWDPVRADHGALGPRGAARDTVPRTSHRLKPGSLGGLSIREEDQVLRSDSPQITGRGRVIVAASGTTHPVEGQFA